MCPILRWHFVYGLLQLTCENCKDLKKTPPIFGKLKVNKQLSSNLIVSKCNHCTGCRRTCECQNCEGSWEKYRNKVKVRFSTKQKTQLVCWWMCEDLKVTRDGVVRSQLPEVSWWRMCENCEELKLTRDGVVSSQRSKNSPKYWWMKGPQPKDEDSKLGKRHVWELWRVKTDKEGWGQWPSNWLRFRCTFENLQWRKVKQMQPMWLCWQF